MNPRNYGSPSWRDDDARPTRSSPYGNDDDRARYAARDENDPRDVQRGRNASQGGPYASDVGNEGWASDYGARDPERFGFGGDIGQGRSYEGGASVSGNYGGGWQRDEYSSGAGSDRGGQRYGEHGGGMRYGQSGHYGDTGRQGGTRMPSRAGGSANAESGYGGAGQQYGGGAHYGIQDDRPGRGGGRYGGARGGGDYSCGGYGESRSGSSYGATSAASYGSPDQHVIGSVSGARDAGSGQWQSHRGRGPKGYARSDERLKEAISERLMDDDRIDASEITVEVSGAEVTLTGTVDQRYIKYEVEELVHGISGVKDVHNQLRVAKSGSLGGSGGQTAASGPNASTTSGSTATTGTQGGTTAGGSGTVKKH